MRDKTHASHKLEDDVHQEEKMRRLQEVLPAPSSVLVISLSTGDYDISNCNDREEHQGSESVSIGSCGR